MDLLSQATVSRMMQLDFCIYEVTRFSITTLSSPVAISPIACQQYINRN